MFICFNVTITSKQQNLLHIFSVVYTHYMTFNDSPFRKKKKKTTRKKKHTLREDKTFVNMCVSEWVREYLNVFLFVFFKPNSDEHRAQFLWHLKQRKMMKFHLHIVFVTIRFRLNKGFWASVYCPSKFWISQTNKWTNDQTNKH